MDKLTSLHRSRQLILGAGVLLLIFTFFSWQSVEFAGVEVASRNAWHGFWGVLLGLATIAILLWVGLRAADVAMPESLPDGLVTAALGLVVFLCALLKNLTDDYSAWASYVGLILAALVAVGAFMAFQESGESLPQMPTRTAAATGGGAAAATTAPPAEAPAAPSEPAPSEPPASESGDEPPPGSGPA
jgi:hypothetical protein